MKLFLLKVRYFVLSATGFITSNKTTLRKKLLIGGIIIGMITISSCRVFIPRTCYKPAPPPPPETPEKDEIPSE